ncbi:MAG TPA: pyridoxamine 5'-phosphate oxidase family protein [Acidimicrobiia bacterium]|nr:pyridoxamine 5'-phosphate oxidase family protein [Acidimicrobiia bacterium]
MPTEFPASHLDLLRGPNTAVVSTIGDDGVPHSAAIWFLLDDDGLLKTSAVMALKKYRDMAARPVCCLFVMDPDSIWRYIEVRADVEFIPDPDKSFVGRISAKYGVDLSGVMPTLDRSIAVFRPRHVVAFHHQGREAGVKQPG